jgi:transposase-like protein
VSQNRSVLFRGRHFEDVIIILCVRWYLRYSLSYRDLEEMMAERGLSVDHVTVWRWVQHYAPILNQRLRRELRHPNRSWRVDETYVRVAGKWAYLYRAVVSVGDTIDFMLSAQGGPDCGQALPALSVIRRRRHRAAGDQCGWTPGICSRYRRAEALRRSQPALSLSAITLFKQHH